MWLKHLKRAAWNTKLKRKKQIFVIKTENPATSGLKSEKQNAVGLLCTNKGKTFNASFSSGHFIALKSRKSFTFI